MKRLGVTVVQNPSHFMLPAVMGARLGARAARTTLMKSLLDAGVPVALGSDGPGNPYLNLMFATINANNPAEAMTREQAIAASVRLGTRQARKRPRAAFREACSPTSQSSRRTSSPCLRTSCRRRPAC